MSSGDEEFPGRRRCGTPVALPGGLPLRLDVSWIYRMGNRLTCTRGPVSGLPCGRAAAGLKPYPANACQVEERTRPTSRAQRLLRADSGFRYYAVHVSAALARSRPSAA